MSDSFYSSIEPISDFIEPFKRKSKIHYGFQGYFTTQPFNVVSEYINHFSQKGDLIVDPFGGSGVTAVEALKSGRKTFISDLNPFAIFISRAKCNIVDIEKLIQLFDKIVLKSKKEFNEIEKLNEKELENLGIPYWYPQNVKLPSNADTDFLDQIFTKKQLYGHSLINDLIEKLPNSPEKDILKIIFCGALSKANKCYDLPDDGRSVNAGQFTIFSKGRYWIPKVPVDISPIEAFENRGARVIEAKKETNYYLDKQVVKNFRAEICSATDLSKFLKDKSVDYIYTDPPYGGHITYLDLSIVYNSWLQFKVSDSMREQEAIEGGELKQSRSKYFDLLGQSFEEMARILKPNRWCSLVFHHKEPSLWTNIVETAKEVGFEFRNTVVQHTKLPSWHKIDVPQSVMSCQMIINFQRKNTPKNFYVNKNLTLDQLILNVAEREIIKRTGANLEEIINALVPELFMHNIVDNSSQTKTDYIRKLLVSEFEYSSESLLYHIKHDKIRTIGSYIPMEEKIKMYLVSFLKRKGKAEIDDIISHVFPYLVNGRSPSNQEILNELEKIANLEGKYWVFKNSTFQKSINFEERTSEVHEDPEIPIISEHNQMIYMLAVLGRTYKMGIKIGNQEQRVSSLKQENTVSNFNYPGLGTKQMSYINNIDCLWVHKKTNTPLFAFEVEHSTEIDSAFERFIAILKAESDIGQQRRLILVISQKNRRKFEKKMKESSYIGSPHFLNNKIRYMFEETLSKEFNKLLKEKDFTMFMGLLSEPQLG